MNRRKSELYRYRDIEIYKYIYIYRWTSGSGAFAAHKHLCIIPLFFTEEMNNEKLNILDRAASP